MRKRRRPFDIRYRLNPPRRRRKPKPPKVVRPRPIKVRVRIRKPRERYRAKVHAVDEPQTFHVDISGSPSTSYDWIGGFSTTESVMMDHVGTGSQNQCVHLKRSVDLKEWPPMTLQGSAAHIVSVTPPSVEGILLPVGFTPPIPDFTLDFKRFQSNASDWFRQQYRSKVSIANYIYELKDLKSVMERFSRSFTSRSLAIVKQELREEASERARGGIGSNFLDFTFNWKPLVEDFGKLLKAHSIVNDRYTFLSEQSDYRDHYGAKFEIEPGDRGFAEVTVFKLSDHIGMQATAYDLVLRPNFCVVEFHAGASIENHLNLTALSRWDAIADQLGLNNSPKILWNATKLSWLVDFFVDSHDFWNAFEVQAHRGYLGVSNTMFSWKIRRMYDVVVRGSSFLPGDEQEVVCGSVMYTEYVRSPGTFHKGSLISPDSDGLDDGQVKILAGLADSLTGSTGKAMSYFSSFWLKKSKQWKWLSRGTR